MKYDIGEYGTAIDMLLAAKACNPDTNLPDILIKKTFIAIDALRLEANIQKKQANDLRVIALKEKREADLQRAEAQKNARHARSVELSSKARLKNAQGDRTIALRLALAAVQMAPTEESKSALADILSDTLNEFYKLEINAFKNNIHSATFSPSGKSFAAIWGKDVRIWNLNGDLQHTLEGHSDTITAIAFSPDGSRILTGGRDNMVLIWDTTGIEKKNLGRQNAITAVIFSPDGRYAAATSANLRVATVWDTSGKLVRSIRDTFPINIIAFSKSGDSLLTGSINGMVKLWDVKTKKMLQRYKLHHKFVTSVAFSPDGEYFLSGSLDSSAYLTNWGGNIKTVYKHNGGVASIAFSPNGDSILTGSADHTAILWNRKGTRLKSFVHHGPITTVGFSPDGALIITGGSDHVVRLWNSHGIHLPIFKEDTDKILSVSFSFDNDKFFRTASPARITIYNDKGNKIKIYTLKDDSIQKATFSKDGKYLLTLNSKNIIKYWSSSGELKQTIPINSRSHATTLTFSPDGQWILAGGKNCNARIWDTSGILLGTIIASATINAIAVSRDRRFIATGGDGDKVRLYKVDSHVDVKLIKECNHNSDVKALAFSPIGDYLLSADNSGMIKLWNLKGDLLQIYQRPIGISSLAFSSDGSNILSGDDEGTVCFWSVDGTLLQSYKAHYSAVSTVAFSKNKALFLSGGEGGALHLVMNSDSFLRSGEVAELTNLQKKQEGVDVELNDFKKDLNMEALLNSAEYFADSYNYEGKKEDLDYAKQLYDQWIDILVIKKPSVYELHTLAIHYFDVRINKVDRTSLNQLYLDCKKRVENYITDQTNLLQQKDEKFIYDEATRFDSEANWVSAKEDKLNYEEKAVDAFLQLDTSRLHINKIYTNSYSPNREDTFNIKPQIARAYGNLSYYQVLNRQFSSAIISADLGLKYDSAQTWIITNKVLGYLFNNRTDEATKIYQTYKNKPWTLDPRFKTMREAFLQDLADMEANDIINDDIEKMQVILNSNKD